MLGEYRVPCNGAHTPSEGATWVPSVRNVSCGFGRRKAVISWARLSSTLISPACKVGFAARKRSRRSGQEKALCPKAPVVNQHKAAALIERRGANFFIAL